MSTHIYEYISELEFRQYRAQWQQLIDNIKQSQPGMVRVRIDERTVLEVAEGKNLDRVIKRYQQGREAYYNALLTAE